MNDRDVFERLDIRPNARNDGGRELRLRCWVHFLRAVRGELASRTGLPWKQRFAAWRAGFTSRSWMLYELEQGDPGRYLADFKAILNGYRVNGFYHTVLGNKLVLSRLLDAHGIPHPRVCATLIEGKLRLEDQAKAPALAAALDRVLEHSPRLVFRPVRSGCGEGVFFLDREDGGLCLNGHPVTLDEAARLLAALDGYVVTEFVQQARYARAIFPGSTNTLRVLTLWDAATGAPFTAAVIHRFGARASGPTDHWDKGEGGYCASVDRATGIMGPAVSLAADNHLRWVSAHPDSGAAIEGVAIPGFRECIDGVLGAAEQFPFCPSIGWDVVLTDDGYRIIEANTIQGLSIMQVHQPLLDDPRTRAFYERWGMA